MMPTGTANYRGVQYVRRGPYESIEQGASLSLFHRSSVRNMLGPGGPDSQAKARSSQAKSLYKHAGYEIRTG